MQTSNAHTYPQFLNMGIFLLYVIGGTLIVLKMEVCFMDENIKLRSSYAPKMNEHICN